MTDQILKKGIIIIPCYNEEDMLPETIETLVNILNKLIEQKKVCEESHLLFVDDGSTDKTWSIIEENNTSSEKIKGIKLSKNFGHQNALLAGITYAKNKSDFLITIDADLQDDPEIITEFVNKYLEGNEIVYGVRKSRKHDSFFKQFSAKAFYKFQKLMGVKSIEDHADYRLLSKKATEALDSFKETNLYLRGIISLVGFKSSIIYYERLKRAKGKTKYSLRKMISLGLDGITSFSVSPLRYITITGFFVFCFSVLYSFYSLYSKYILNENVKGWTSLIILICFLGGIQVISIGIVGEYIGKIYKEVKSRPRFIIDKEL